MPAPSSPISHVRKLNNVTRTCQTPTKRPLKDVCPPRRGRRVRAARVRFMSILADSPFAPHGVGVCRCIVIGRSSSVRGIAEISRLTLHPGDARDEMPAIT